jgi:hypothetical protein
MRLSPRSLLVPAVTLLACLLPASSPAFAQEVPPAVTLSSCDRQVCEAVTLVSPTDLHIAAHANPPAGACGHFEATTTTPTDVVHAVSAGTCSAKPTWWTETMLPRSSASALVRVRFVSEPATAGEPLVTFSSLSPPAA